VISEHDYARIPAELGLKRSEIVQVIDDSIHGPIPLTEFADALLRTPQIQRLKHVAMLGLLNGMAALNTSASRYEHTLGTYKMGLIITRRQELRDLRMLQVANDICHDGTKAPFDHSTEPEQKIVMGGDHEELVEREFAGTEVEDVMKRFGVSFEGMGKAVQAKHPVAIVNEMLHCPFGTDSEGTCRYAMMRHHGVYGLPFDPAAIAYCIKPDENGHIMLHGSPCFPFDLAIEVQKACQTRKNIFNMIYDPVIEGPEVQVARAAHFARVEGVLPKKFFRMTDWDGTQFLLKSKSIRARTLTERAANNQSYERVYLAHFRWPSEEQIRLIEDEPNQQLFADQVASELGIEPENVCLHMGRYKGVKDLSRITMLTANGQPIVPPNGSTYWFAHAYLHPRNTDLTDRLSDLLDELLLITSPS
jgi:HD superfamily phosphohydrolase